MNQLERLHTLRFGRAHKKLLAGSGIGWALDAMDVGLLSFIMAALAADWQLDKQHLGWLGSAGFAGMMIGASFGGRLADKTGRRTVFAATLLIYGLATGASAFATTLTTLIVLRFIVGLGLGAELPVASTLVAEYSPTHIRGRMVVALESFWALGWILAAIIGYTIIPNTYGDNFAGWRVALLIGVLPAFYALYVRRQMPESVHYLQSVGRCEEAERAVRFFEAGSDNKRYPNTQQDTNTDPHRNATSIFAPGLRTRTAGLWSVWFFVNLAYYGAFMWLPTLLVLQGHSLVKSFGYTLIITLAQLPGYACAAFLVEKWGRRATLASFLIGSACAAGLFATAANTTMILIAGSLLSFFNLGAWGALYAIGPEIYPTHIRATGAGTAAAIGRVAAVIAPMLVPAVMDLGGDKAVFSVFAAAFAIAAASAFALPERKGQSL
ncbi:MFS transporter [Corynebacterium aquilae]|uniref:Membrane protein n=1 Tax=Corynebacterium aquilae DSM 44791 TaxID=1431546 RepID=A0A1L7CEI6_9CORY|nr:MFS transporter [Corynebacterium aquilae]APT84282.1 membrane protein [Corynebacterium aquilae DSM 44791]